VRGTRGEELDLQKSGAGVWYFYGLDSDSSTILEREASGGSFPLLFERSRFRPASQKRVGFKFAGSGGPIFLRSQLSGIQLKLEGRLGSSFAFNLYGAAPGWGASKIGKNDQIGEIK
jgi:hypothetical protein